MIREFFGGVALFFRGFGMWARRPGMMAIGAIPALIVSVLYFTAVIILAINATRIAEWATPFADNWADPATTLVRVLVAVAVVAAGVALGVFTFAAVTLAVAGPFNERISQRTERELGGLAIMPDETFWQGFRRGLGDAARLIGTGILTALLVFLLGLIPVVGSVLGWIAGAFFGGRALAIELTGTPGDARRIPLKQREKMLATRRARSLGFGVCAYLMFLIPLGAVVGTPAAAVGGTLLMRDLLGEPTRPMPPTPPAPAGAALTPNPEPPQH
ncbi:hypothetical protein EG850_05455 [Gulosibacter macacae]|uniref:EI24 domain-containing protein n=1 Tax=Gulosibacter macacae TaxID=2488791 RepID=A0A3P3W0P1_9MICO|nr:EI24 domain-containing protein [Gulosibacter macacae]RRJ87259.1 hypothetical protein EG850_05455 [Gulosibacter macacae]